MTRRVQIQITGETGNGKSVVTDALIAFCASFEGVTVHAASDQDQLTLELTVEGLTNFMRYAQPYQGRYAALTIVCCDCSIGLCTHRRDGSCRIKQAELRK